MNIIDTINQELTGGLLNKLSSLTGQGEMKTKMAAAAAVPAVLSALGGLAATPAGAEKLAVMARKFTPEEMASINSMTTGQASLLFDEGKSALTGLMDVGSLNALLAVLGKFTNFDTDTLKKLLGYLTPIIFGTLTKKFGTEGLTGSTISALFAEQRTNIANALPAGMSLDTIPGAVAAKTAAQAGGGGGGLLLPLVIVLALAGAAYWYFIWKPAHEADAPQPKPAIVNPAPTDGK